MSCNTFECEFSATHWALWRNRDGDLTGGLFCPDCATKLARSGDEVGRIAEPSRPGA